jgi:hypothetical protein
MPYNLCKLSLVLKILPYYIAQFNHSIFFIHKLNQLYTVNNQHSSYKVILGERGQLEVAAASRAASRASATTSAT